MVASGPGGAYEALQLYRSKAIKSKSKGEIIPAIVLCGRGAKCLLKGGYDNAGVELTNLFLEICTEAALDITNNGDIRTLVNEIDDSFKEDSTLRIDFLRACVKWTSKWGPREIGDTVIHLQLASCLWNQAFNSANTKRDISNAICHYAAGEGPQYLCDKIMCSYNEVSQQEKRDQALTLGVSHFLAVENLRDANELFAMYHKAHKNKGIDTKKSQLIIFCDQLLQLSRRDQAVALFYKLIEAYNKIPNVDENVVALLNGPIGQKIFGLQPRPNVMSMISSLLGSV